MSEDCDDMVGKQCCLLGPLTPSQEKIPISLLSGFLGSGKTTLLQEMLHNKGGLKVGIVVNDMAAVNIDSKLVKTETKRRLTSFAGELVDSSDVMELQNGCACCSASEELLQVGWGGRVDKGGEESG